jgi:hypothetical protein
VAYVRFIVSTKHRDSGVEEGLFVAAYALQRAEDTSPGDRESLKELLAWFSENLPIPTRFNRSSSKGYYRRNTKGIAWFRDSAVEHIAQMHALKSVVEANGYTVHVLQKDRVGYIVYRDEVQVIAEPFADTRTGVDQIE